MSTSFEVKSVSISEDEAQRCIVTGPVTSTSSLNGVVWKLRMSLRRFNGKVSVHP